jgi:hypothetical protein
VEFISYITNECHYDYVSRNFPNTFPILTGLFISQEIELSAVVLHHLHGHYEPLQYGMGYQPFHIAVTPIYFLDLYVSLGVLPYAGWMQCKVLYHILVKSPSFLSECLLAFPPRQHVTVQDDCPAIQVWVILLVKQCRHGHCIYKTGYYGFIERSSPW